VVAPATAIELGAAVVAAVAGLLVVLHGFAAATGWLLLATALTVPAWLVSEQGSAVPFTLALVLGGLPPVLAAAAGDVWPVGPLGRADGR
jgi:hypothetical protein